jgi:hypothetical protein
VARIRSIHPDALKSEKLQAASAEAERCYWRLLTHCDDEGRAEDDARLFRSWLFPLDDDLRASTVEGWLSELASLGLIVRYETDGRRYLAVTQWDRFQKPRKRFDSHLPPPPDWCATGARQVRDTETTEGEPVDDVAATKGALGARQVRDTETTEGEPVDDVAATKGALVPIGDRSKEIGEGEGEVIAPRAARKRDDLWDALLAACGINGPIPDSARGAYNRALKDLRGAGATPDSIHQRAVVFRTRWPSVSLTPTALARRWAECEPNPDHLPARRISRAEAALARIVADQ